LASAAAILSRPSSAARSPPCPARTSSWPNRSSPASARIIMSNSPASSMRCRTV
jgi:hypothetical protein